MTQEEVNKLALSKLNDSKFIVLQLITGFGKSKIAIDLANKVASNLDYKPKLLLLVSKTVHKQTWIDEINKWGGLDYDIVMDCYESIKKHKNCTYDSVILDEAHHLSINRREIFETIKINHLCVALSATLKKEMIDYFKYKYKATFINCSLKDAVESNVLPEPKVYLIPLELSRNEVTYKIKKFNKEMITTQYGYYHIFSSMIDWYKRKFKSTGSIRIKNVWLSMAGERLKWLAKQKESITKELLHKLRNERTLTFCSSIEQAELLGQYNITSKNKNSAKYLDMFNNKEVNHITACNLLNEGVNLTDCRIGIFACLNSSELLYKQKIGRLLRHKAPILIIPYYEDTREEEILEKMLAEYSKDSIKVVKDFKNWKV